MACISFPLLTSNKQRTARTLCMLSVMLCFMLASEKISSLRPSFVMEYSPATTILRPLNIDGRNLSIFFCKQKKHIKQFERISRKCPGSNDLCLFNLRAFVHHYTATYNYYYQLCVLNKKNCGYHILKIYLIYIYVYNI